MTFPNLVQHGQIREVPAWAKFLAKIGRYMAHSDRLMDGNSPKIAVVCLPRIDYAALFTAYGSLNALSNAEGTGVDSQNINLDVLLNKTVSYLKIKGHENTIILGRLESIDHSTDTANLVTKISNSSYFRCGIGRKDWHWVRGTDISFDITKGATDHQRLRAGEAYLEYHNIAKVVGHALASAATRISEPYLTVIGEKNRFIEELESLEFNSNEASIPVGVLLNSENESGKYFRNSGRHIDLLASGRSLSEAKTSVVIIEAGRRLGDQLQQLGENKRAIILVAANKRSHNDVVELLAPLINFRGLCEPAPELGEIPQYIKTIFIR